VLRVLTLPSEQSCICVLRVLTLPSEQSCICVLRVLTLPVYTIFRLNFGTALTV
jgi:hypothetical protein